MNQLRVWLTAADSTSFVGKTLGGVVALCVRSHTQKKEIIAVVLMPSKISPCFPN